MADLKNVNANLARRILWVIAEADARGRKGQCFYVTTGWRSMDEQRRLYQAYLNGGTLAAVPGTSKHGRYPSVAVDLACDYVDNKLRAQLFNEAGLATPIKSEPWHAEVAANAKPLPLPTQSITPQKVTSIVGNKCIGIWTTPTGNGIWIVADNGGLFCYGDAQFFGNPVDKTSTKISGFAPMPKGDGYRMVGEDGGVFDYGSAQHIGSAVDDLGYVRQKV